jgi:hypothetical protein
MEDVIHGRGISSGGCEACKASPCLKAQPGGFLPRFFRVVRGMREFTVISPGVHQDFTVLGRMVACFCWSFLCGAFRYAGACVRGGRWGLI